MFEFTGDTCCRCSCIFRENVMLSRRRLFARPGGPFCAHTLLGPGGPSVHTLVLLPLKPAVMWVLGEYVLMVYVLMVANRWYPAASSLCTIGRNVHLHTRAKLRAVGIRKFPVNLHLPFVSSLLCVESDTFT